MTQEIQIPGGRVTQWLARAPQDEWAVLVGCAVDDGHSLDAWTISAVHPGQIEVVQAASSRAAQRKPWGWLDRGFLLVPPDRTDILRLLDQSRSPYEREVDEAKERLRGYGLNPDRLASAGDTRILDAVLSAAAETGIVPSGPERSSVYEVVRRAGQDRSAIPFFRRWFEALEAARYPDADVLARLHLAVLLRHAGAIRESLEISEALNWRDRRLRGAPSEIAMLSCNRAAALLDRFEHTWDPDLLPEARRHLNRAWAIEQSEELSDTYRRWHRLNEKHEETSRVPNAGRKR